jgi:hypothetical protein
MKRGKMSDFCQECSIRMFGKDTEDFAGECSEDQMVQVLCEGCGVIWVDKNGKRINLENE